MLLYVTYHINSIHSDNVVVANHRAMILHIYNYFLILKFNSTVDIADYRCVKKSDKCGSDSCHPARFDCAFYLGNLSETKKNMLH